MLTTYTPCSSEGRAAGLLVCVHGLGGCSRGFERVVPALSCSHHVVCVDMPGFGVAPHRYNKKLSLDADLCGGLLHAVLAHVPWGAPVTLLGHSFGCLVCARFCALYPGLVHRLVFVNPVGLTHSIGRHGQAAALLHGLLVLPVLRLLARLPGWATALAAALLSFATVPAYGRDFGRFYARLLVRGLPGHALVGGRLDPLSALPWVRPLRRLRLPPHCPAPRLAVISGARDVLCPIWQSRRVARRMGAYVFGLLPDCGHCPFWESPAQFMALLQAVCGPKADSSP